MNKDIENIQLDAIKLESEGDFRSALEKYKELALAEPQNIEALFKLAEMHHQLGELPKALSAYIRVADLQPDHKKANVKIEMIKSIMDFFNPDLYNP
ncbi:MAG: tetratricopeptide repeat protein [Marinifilaceae bacterium]|nr:tetratricopeptide repeat protein [Marinifilaceae bacterium]